MSEEQGHTMNKGVELGGSPGQVLRTDRPTHACFHTDGTTSIVFPEGHEPEMVVRLPKGYSEETHEIDHASRSFVKRTTPLPTPEPGLHERVQLLEQQLAALTAQGER